MVKRYLKTVSLNEALSILKTISEFKPSTETITVTDSLSKITSKPVFSGYSVPMIHLSAMDGIAVKSSDTIGARDSNPLLIKDYVRVNTGNFIPRGYDSVIMIEDTWEEEEGFLIRKSVSKWNHIRPVGEDIGESEMILPSNHKIRANDIGALAGYGVRKIDVKKLSAGIIPTGSELKKFGDPIEPGIVIDSNTLMAGAMLEEAGVLFNRYNIVRDEKESIKNAVEKAVFENDFVLISAGSSAGTKDFTVTVIEELGEVLVHGIGIKPGKPAIIGKIKGKPVIGLPGYPLACLTIMREIVYPMLELYGFRTPYRQNLSVELSTSLNSPIGTDEFVMMSVGKVGDRFVGIPQSRGSGVQMSAVRANAILKIPKEKEGISAGTTVDVSLLVTPPQAENSLLIIGSHDPCIDYLSDMASLKGVNIHSGHVGSMGGILALKKNTCHAAPVHLLSEDGDYNVSYIRKYLPDKEIYLLCVAEREQGIASKNSIKLADLPKHSFINRQKGSGTRILLDYMLNKNGIDPSSIEGYDSERTTHLDVALAIKNDEADAGMCIYSAAKLLKLSFVPVIKERYEIAYYGDKKNDLRIKTLIECINSEEFKSVLKRTGGYDTSCTGQIRKVQ
ncbi:MAG: molybdopterin biosynthesis protein [Methanomicrobiaceae archaeon]|nr:molybdopterin biosynthesis protein [Methanomicrobiaceae archaeon]